MVTQTHRDKLALASIFTTYSRTEAYSILKRPVYILYWNLFQLASLVWNYIPPPLPCYQPASPEVVALDCKTVFFGIEVQYRGRVRDEPDLHCFLQTWSFSVTIDYVL